MSDIISFIKTAPEISSGGQYSPMSSSDDGTIVATVAIGSLTTLRVFNTLTSSQPGSPHSQIGGDIHIGEPISSVSLSGDGKIVACSNSVNGNIQTFQYNNNDWQSFGGIIFPTTATVLKVSLSADGKTVAVGGKQTSDPKAFVRVYGSSSSNGTATWLKLGSDLTGDSNTEMSSLSLSGSGTTVAIGSVLNQSNFVGHVRVYERDASNNWNQLGENIEGGVGGDYFGKDVSLSFDGRTVAIAGTVSQAYLFSASSWEQLQGIEDGGESVSLSSDGTTMAVGNDVGRVDGGGVVNVYGLIKDGPIFDSKSWVKLSSKIISSEVGTKFGYNVSLSGDGTILIGESRQVGSSTIKIYKKNLNINILFEYLTTFASADAELKSELAGLATNLAGLTTDTSFAVDLTKTNLSLPSTWVQAGSDFVGEAAGDQSGYNVSLSGDGRTMAIGAQYNDGLVDVGTSPVILPVNSKGGAANNNGSGLEFTVTNNPSQPGQNSLTITVVNGGSNYLEGNILDINNEWFGTGTGSHPFSIKVTSAMLTNNSFSNNNQDLLTALQEAVNKINSGHVRVYVRDPSNAIDWVQLGGDIEGRQGVNDEFGHSVSLSADGTTVAIGSRTGNYVIVYEWDITTNDWEKVGTDIEGEAFGDTFGQSISLSADGRTMAIGAIGNDGLDVGTSSLIVPSTSQGDAANNNGSGLEFTVTNNPSQPGQNSLTITGVNGGSNYLEGNILDIPKGWFGTDSQAFSISVNDDMLTGNSFSTSDNEAALLTALQQAVNKINSGHVRVYVRDPTGWRQVGADINGVASYDNSGHSVSLSADGRILAIGDRANNGFGGSGHVRVYQFVDVFDVWSLVGDIEGEAAGDDESGYSVSLSADGTTVAIGASYNDGNGSNSGHVRVYERDAGKTTAQTDQTLPNYGPIGWNRVGGDIDGEAANNLSGWSVSLSADGTIVAIGAIYNVAGGIPLGHVRVYVRDANEAIGWNQLGGDIDGEAEWDQSGWSVSLSDDGTIVAIGAPFNDANGSKNSGHVRVYELPNGFQKIISNLRTEFNDADTAVDKKLTDAFVAADGVLDTKLRSAFAAADKLLTAAFEDADKKLKAAFEADDKLLRNDLDVLTNDTTFHTWLQVGGDIEGQAADDQSGYSVSLSDDGTIVAIGAPYNDGVNGSDSGHVRVYERDASNANNWNQLGGDINGVAADDLSGWSVSLSGDGTTVAIGSSSGHVRLYKRDPNNANNWNQLGENIDGEATDDQSGYSVSLSYDGTIVAIGAIYNDGKGSNSGHVRVYVRDAGKLLAQTDQTKSNFGPVGWNRVGEDINGVAADDLSGWSVSLSGDGTTVAIGSIKNGDGGSSSGHVRLYKRDPNNANNWNQLGENIDGEATDDQSGYSVSLSYDGTIVAIGAPYNDGKGSNSGHVRVYVRDAGKLYAQRDQTQPNYGPAGWNRVGEDIDGEAAGDQSGFSVSLSGDGTIVAIGAPYANSTGNVRVYVRDPNEAIGWNQLGGDIDDVAAGDQSGYSVSLSKNGKTMAIARYNDGLDVGTSPVIVPVTSKGNGSGLEFAVTNNTSQPGQTSLSINVVNKGSNYLDGNILDINNEWFGKAFSITVTAAMLTNNSFSNDSALLSALQQAVNNNINSGLVRVYELDSVNEIEKIISNLRTAFATADTTLDTQLRTAFATADTTLKSALTADFKAADDALTVDFKAADDALTVDFKAADDALTVDFKAADDALTVDFKAADDALTVDFKAADKLLRNDLDDLTSATSFAVDLTKTNLSTPQWLQLGSDIDGELYQDKSGYNVSLSADGTTVAIGAPYNDGLDVGTSPLIVPSTSQGDAANNNGSGLEFTVTNNPSQPGQNSLTITVVNGGSNYLEGNILDIPNEWFGTGTGSQAFSITVTDAMLTNNSFSNDNQAALLTALQEAVNKINSGHVRVYVRDPTKITAQTDQTLPNFGPIGWNRVGGDIDGEAAVDNSGWSVSLSGDGTIVAIGAVRNDGNGHGSGHVRVYERDAITDSWVQVGTDINGEAADDFIGHSVSLSYDGKIVAIGAIYNDGNGSGSGHVRVYEINTSNDWVQVGTDIDGEDNWDQSGWRVSLSDNGTIVAIGAIYNGSNSGHVRVYERDATKITAQTDQTLPNFGPAGWNRVGEDIEGEAAYDLSGYSVSLSGDGTILAIGAVLNDGNGSNSGHVRVYERDASKTTAQTNQTLPKFGPAGWNRVGEDIDGEAAGDESGYSVSLSYDGTIVAIGAFLKDNANWTNDGHVRIYVQDPNETIGWRQVGEDIDGETTYDNSGYSVSLSADGTTVAIGAPYNDANGSDSGHVRVYKIGNEFEKIISNLKIADTNNNSNLTALDGVVDELIYDTSFAVDLTKNDWRQVGADIDGVAANLDYSGYSVSLSKNGKTMAIGAILNDCLDVGTSSLIVPSTSQGDAANNNGSGLEFTVTNNPSQPGQNSLTITVVNGGSDYLEGNILNIPNQWFGTGYQAFSITVTAAMLTNNSFSNESALLSALQQEINSGLVRVYERDASNNWVQVGGDIEGEANLDNSGYSVSLSADGTIVAIGAPYNNANGSDSGHVRVYVRDPTKITAQTDQTLPNFGPIGWNRVGGDIDGEAAYDNSGYSVSLSADGTTVAIGARYNDGNGSDSGHVRVYEINASNDWVQLGGDIDGEAAWDQSGYSVSLSDDGTIVAIGARVNDANGQKTSTGHVRVYEINTSNDWVQVGTDIDGELGYDQSGYSVSLSADGTTVAIGAPYNDGVNGQNHGHVRVYVRDPNEAIGWRQVGEDIVGELGYDQSGWSVSLSADGTTVAIGAPYNDGENHGHVRVYVRDARKASWRQVGTDIVGEAAYDLSGYSVSLSADGTILAIGAPLNDANGSNSGHVRVYELDAVNEFEQIISNLRVADDTFTNTLTLANNAITNLHEADDKFTKAIADLNDVDFKLEKMDNRFKADIIELTRLNYRLKK